MSQKKTRVNVLSLWRHKRQNAFFPRNTFLLGEDMNEKQACGIIVISFFIIPLAGCTGKPSPSSSSSDLATKSSNLENGGKKQPSRRNKKLKQLIKQKRARIASKKRIRKIHMDRMKARTVQLKKHESRMKGQAERIYQRLLQKQAQQQARGTQTP